MVEVTEVGFSILKVLTPTLTELLRGQFSTNTIDTGDIEDILSNVTRASINARVEEAKGILDRNEVVNWETSKKLAKTITVAEISQDAIDYISKHKLKGNKCRIVGRCDTLIKELEENTVTSGDAGRGEIPLQGNSRRFLLYLSYFQESYIFNHKRISRLAVANQFTLENSSEGPHRIEVESCWDADEVREDRIAYHFTISNIVKEQSLRWPEKYAIRRHLVCDLASNSGSEIHDESYLSSLIFLSCNERSLDIKKQKFLFIRVLSLRNVNLINQNDLRKLSFIRYLDLKNSNVGNCDWLESLEELEVLDLRYTFVQTIRGECLKKLTKLKHLLLGSNAQNGVKGIAGVKSLAGAKLKVEQLGTKDLDTLRAIRWPMKKNDSINKVVDLSVTDIEPKDLKDFWNAVKNFEKLTILGVAVTKGSVITLQDCPDELKNKLKRLQMEGQFTPQTCLDKLKHFKSLVDLTLVSSKAVSSIPTLPHLICLRLYGIHKDKVLTINKGGFNRLKKLVIGDMRKLEMVKIGSAIITQLATLKLCNLPLFREVAIVYADEKQSPLLILKSTTTEVYNVPREEKKIIFLKNILKKSDQIPYSCSPNLEIYDYDMDKQCYEKLHRTTT